MWNQDIKRFNASFPNIKITLSTPPNEDTAAYTQTLVAAGGPPDVSTLLQDSPAFWPMLVPFDLKDPDISQLTDADKVIVGGQLLAVGPAKEIQNDIFYNKDMFAAAGITTLPTTYAEFDTDLQKLKAAGDVPMDAALGSGASWSATHLINAFSDAIKKDPNWYLDYNAGKVHYSDPDWVAAGQRLSDWVKAGYFNSGALGETTAQIESDFLSGKGAMYQMGTWFTAAVKANPPKFAVGIMAPPSEDGKPVIQGIAGRGGYSVLKSSKHTCEATLFAKFLVFDPASLQAYLDADGQFSSITLKSGPLQRTFTPLQMDAEKLLDSMPLQIGEYGMGDNSPRAGVMNPALINAVENIMQGADPKTELAKVDAAWQAAPAN